MEANRNMKIDTLKARIVRSDYEVDAEAVAEAIVLRLLAARRTTAADLRGADGSGPVEPASAA